MPFVKGATKIVDGLSKMTVFDEAWDLVKNTIEGRTHDDEGNPLPWNQKTPSWFKISEEQYKDMEEGGSSLLWSQTPYHRS